MPEPPLPSTQALQRATLIFSRSAGRQPPSAAAVARQRDALIRSIARALDDLARPLRGLVEGIRDPPDRDAFLERVETAAQALRRFDGSPLGQQPDEDHH